MNKITINTEKKVIIIFLIFIRDHNNNDIDNYDKLTIFEF